jgi:hypothetical protein
VATEHREILRASTNGRARAARVGIADTRGRRA